MAPLKQGSRGVLGIRGMWGGVKEDRGMIVAPLHGILTKKMVVPPTVISNWVMISSRGWGSGFLKLACPAEFGPYMWQLVLAQLPFQKGHLP